MMGPQVSFPPGGTGGQSPNPKDSDDNYDGDQGPEPDEETKASIKCLKKCGRKLAEELICDEYAELVGVSKECCHAFADYIDCIASIPDAVVDILKPGNVKEICECWDRFKDFDRLCGPRTASRFPDMPDWLKDLCDSVPDMPKM